MARTFVHLPGVSIVGRIGRGARAVIYEGRDVRTRKRVAIKHVVRKSPDDDRFFEQAEAEYNVCRQLDAENLRKVFDIVRARRWLKTSELFLIMELVAGETLENRCKNQSPPEVFGPLIAIFLQVARGLQAMHHAGFAHADIKPNNILIMPDNRVKIIDFGQSCPLGHKKERVQGTPDYIAPEQVQRLPIDQRTDVFNLGATMYWVTTGKWFRTLLNIGATATRKIEIDARSGNENPEAVNPNMSIPLARLIQDCCATRPDDRPQDMRQVISRLETTLHILGRKNGATPAIEAN